MILRTLIILAIITGACGCFEGPDTSPKTLQFRKLKIGYSLERCVAILGDPDEIVRDGKDRRMSAGYVAPSDVWKYSDYAVWIGTEYAIFAFLDNDDEVIDLFIGGT